MAAEDGLLVPGRVEPAVEGRDCAVTFSPPVSEASDGRRLPGLLPGLLDGAPEGRRTGEFVVATEVRAPRGVAD